MAVFAGVVYVFRRELLLEFLTDMDAYEIAFYALQIQCLTLPFIPVCICGNMLFQSIGKGGRATILASFRSGTIYIPALLILTAFWGIRQYVTRNDVILYSVDEIHSYVYIRSVCTRGRNLDLHLSEQSESVE